jgi:uncharacterized protein (TIGR04255 family)
VPSYTKDPIVEAVLGIHLATPMTLSIGAVREKLATKLHEYKVQRDLPGQPEEPGNSEPERSVKQSPGFALENDNKSVHVRTDEFSFHWQKPYISWDVFFPEAWRCWEMLKASLDSASVASAYVRYINNIPLPLGSSRVHLDSYFTSVPNVPQFDGSIMEDHFSQSFIDIPGRSIHVLVAQATLSNTATSKPFVIDINVHNHSSPENINLKAIFNEFRTIKNDVFEQLIKDDCRNLIK